MKGDGHPQGGLLWKVVWWSLPSDVWYLDLGQFVYQILSALFSADCLSFKTMALEPSNKTTFSSLMTKLPKHQLRLVVGKPFPGKTRLHIVTVF